MKRMLVVTFTMLALVGASHSVAAQEVAGAGRAEVGIPVGNMWFSSGDSDLQPSFRNLALGATGTYNANRLFGFEAEFGAGIGNRQTVTVNGADFRTKVPNTFSFNGNLVYNPWGSDTRWVPYATGGIGAFTFRRSTNEDRLGDFTSRETFFSQNFGGGVKWFTASHWGLRGDYRFLIVNGKNDANPFFAVDNNENRFANRVYGSFVLTY